MRFILLFIGISFWIGSLFSQTNETIEKILERLDKEQSKDVKVSLLDNAADYYLTRNPDSALYFIEKGLQLSREIDYLEGQAEMLGNMGDYLVMQDRLSEAKSYYQQSSELYEKTGAYEQLAGIYLVLANVHWVQDNYLFALDYYIRGERIADSLDQEGFLADFHNNLGTVYLKLEDYEQSLKYYKSAIEIFRSTSNLQPIPISMVNMVTVYMYLDRLEDARELCAETIKITDSIPESGFAKVLAYQEFGNIEYSLGDFELALDYYSRALSFMDELHSGYMGPRATSRAIILLKYGYCLFELERFDEAMDVLNEAHQLGSNAGQLGVVQDASLKLSQLYDKKGDLKKSLEYLRVHIQYADSLSNEELTRQITQIQMQHEFDKTLRQKEMERLKQEEAQKRKELILFIAILGILAALVFVFLLLRLQKNKTKRIQLEQKTLKLDLEYKNKELTTNVMYLLKKNEFIMTISDKLTKMRYRFKEENREVIDEVIREIESSSKEVNWKDFELRFQDVHSEFYKKINKQFPDLTPNELKLCAFLRLNMTTKEISSITYQSYNSIIMARHRLRKKLDIESAENLVAYLQGL